MTYNTSEITRLEIISDEKREFVKSDCKIIFSIQDNGKTLKIFIKDN